MTSNSRQDAPAVQETMRETYLRMKLETMRMNALIEEARAARAAELEDLQSRLRASNAALDAVIAPRVAIVRMRMMTGVHYQVGNIFVRLVTKPGLGWLTWPVRLARIAAHHLLVAAIRA